MQIHVREPVPPPKLRSHFRNSRFRPDVLKNFFGMALIGLRMISEPTLAVHGDVHVPYEPVVSVMNVVRTGRQFLFPLCDIIRCRIAPSNHDKTKPWCKL